MAQISSRQGLIDYSLIRLGNGMIDINVTEDQLNQAVDDALQFVQMFDSDFTQHIFLKRAITANEIIFNSLNGAFITEEYVISDITKSTFKIFSIGSTSLFSVSIVQGDLIVGETITGQKSGATAIVNSVVIGDTQTHSIPVPDNVISVTKVLNFNQNSSSLDLNMFSAKYQMFMNDIFSITGSSIVYYTQVMTQLNMLEDVLGNNQTPIRFNRHTGKVYIDADWHMFRPGDFIVLECYAILDPAEFTKTFNDMNFKKLVTAYIKRQWGNNLGKFSQISLPGGVKLRGGEMYQEAVLEIQEIETDIQSRFEVPAVFLIG